MPVYEYSLWGGLTQRQHGKGLILRKSFYLKDICVKSNVAQGKRLGLGNEPPLTYCTGTTSDRAARSDNVPSPSVLLVAEGLDWIELGGFERGN